MTPGARIQELITMINEMDFSRGPADVYAHHYYKGRRYMGSKDRRWMNQGFFSFLRLKGAVEGLIRFHKLSVTPRLEVLALLLLNQSMTLTELQEACGDDRYAPKALLFDEESFLKQLTPQSMDVLPIHEQLSLPFWWVAHLEQAFGNEWMDEVRALNQDAPLDMRVNTLKATRDEAMTALRKEGFNPQPTSFSPVGVRLPPRSYIMETAPYKEGVVEVQDEGSQLIVHACDAASGMTVLDMCAGAGGKTLALAAAMRNKGQLIGTDIVPERLENAKKRLRKAGVHNVTLHLFVPGDKWVKRHQNRFDRVLVDAPCSGSGTWRRNPDLKWRVTSLDIDELVNVQTSLLNQAAGLVKPGGRLIYSTCSIMNSENECQIDRFLESHPDFFLKPLGGFQQKNDEEVPLETSYLRVSPRSHGTDGFFVAVLEKKKNETV